MVNWTGKHLSAILPPMPEEYVLVIDAAAELGMTRAALWKAIQRDRIQVRRQGGIITIPRSELERFKQTPRRNGWPPGRPRKG